MTYRSFIDNFPLPVQRLMADPTSWAVVGSVGLHGIILALLPFMSLPSFEDTEPNIENRVPVIELDSEQLSRVPDFSAMEAPLPDDPALSDSEDFTFDDYFDLPNTSVPNAPPRPDPFQSRVQRPPIQWPSWPQIPSTPSPRPRLRPPSNPAPAQQQERPSEDSSAETETAENTPEQDSQNSTDTEQTDTEQTDTEQTDTEQTDGSEVAANETGEPSDSEEPPTPQERLLAEQQQLQQQFTYREPSEGEVQEAFSLWKEVADEANIQQGEPVSINVSQSLLTCPLGEDVEVIMGVFVGPDNKIMTDPGPQILLSSGYEFFDEEAKAFAAAHDFDNQTGENRSYTVTANFLYDAEACPAAPASQEDVGQSGGEDDTVSQQESSQDESGTSAAESSDIPENNS